MVIVKSEVVKVENHTNEVTEFGGWNGFMRGSS